MIAFWGIVLVGLVWLAYSIGSDRRNPPVKRCRTCDGDGSIASWTVVEGEWATEHAKCWTCEGDGWVPA